MAKKPVKKPGKVVKRAFGGPMGRGREDVGMTAGQAGARPMPRPQGLMGGPQGLMGGGIRPGAEAPMGRSAMMQQPYSPSQQASMANVAAQAAMADRGQGMSAPQTAPPPRPPGMKKGGSVKKMSSGGSTKKRRYDDGGKVTTSSSPAAPEKKKKSNLMLGGLGGLIPMAVQKEGLAGLSPMAMIDKYGPGALSPVAMAMRRKKRRVPGSVAPPATPDTTTTTTTTGATGMKRGGKVKKMAAGGSFSEAFRAARNDPSKPKTFTWRGKSYTTEMAGEKPAAKASTPTAKPAATAPTPKPGRFSTAPSNRTPAPPKKEEPSFGQANRSAYKAMMAESDRMRSDATKARAAKAKADADKYYADREAQRQRDNARPAKTVIDLNPFPSSDEAKAARAKATATRNAVSRKATGRPGQALKRGGVAKKKKKYV